MNTLETLRRIALGVNHALMVLPTPETGGGKRAWQSLIDAKQVAEAAIDHLEKHGPKPSTRQSPHK